MGDGAGTGAPEPAAPDLPPAGGIRKWLGLASPWGAPLKPGELTKKQRRVPLAAGMLAAATALLVGLLLRFQGAGLFVPEAAVDFAVDHIPGSFESAAISVMGGGAKVLALLVAILGFLAVHGAFALFFPRVQRIAGNRWKTVAAFAAAPFAATLLIVLPLFGKGVAGADDPAGTAGALLGVGASSLSFALVLDFAMREFTRTNPDGFDITRRSAIRAAAVILVAGALGAIFLGQFVQRVGRLAFASIAELTANEITPNSSFYTVSKNAISPSVDPSSWRLAVGGLVDRPLSLSSNELLARSAADPHDEFVTLECVSNEVGGNLISNANWTGIPLAQLLADAGVQPAATWVLFECADDYSVGVPLTRARARGAMLALHMNGERLPRDHGFPARILVPGLYGMMHAKWVRSMTLVDHEVEGFWQRKGWTNEGSIKTTAIIAVAPESAVRGRDTEIGGVAFAGDRQITRVEVSEDGGSTWMAATVRAPLSPYAWTLWSLNWRPTMEGLVRLQARAYEMSATGEVVQDRARASPFPAGSSGYDSVEVRVSS